MSDIVIRVEKLCKRYRYGGPARLSTSLRADISDWLKARFNNGKRKAESGKQEESFALTPSPLPLTPSPLPTHPPTLHEIQERHLDASPEYFWALKDVDLEVRRGEVVGMIGRNGAGKSTMLKILARIIPPTSGRVTYHGRVSSLLEVGTGFQRELTGRENVFLNGSILGMKRSEIARKFDEIVAFAEIEKFIDTPVKFFSSGMYVRLAFAVAAHLEPEIMIVDEVLAVGDVAFQSKCLTKMESVAKQGRTILIVSHSTAMIDALTDRCLYLKAGRPVALGPTKQVTQQYLSDVSAKPVTANPLLKSG